MSNPLVMTKLLYCSLKSSRVIASADSTALTKIPPRYHRPLTTSGCIRFKNALVVKHLLR